VTAAGVLNDLLKVSERREARVNGASARSGVRATAERA
jgi:hypothetical protein